MVSHNDIRYYSFERTFDYRYLSDKISDWTRVLLTSFIDNKTFAFNRKRWNWRSLRVKLVSLGKFDLFLIVLIAHDNKKRDTDSERKKKKTEAEKSYYRFYTGLKCPKKAPWSRAFQPANWFFLNNYHIYNTPTRPFRICILTDQWYCWIPAVVFEIIFIFFHLSTCSKMFGRYKIKCDNITVYYLDVSDSSGIQYTECYCRNWNRILITRLTLLFHIYLDINKN